MAKRKSSMSEGKKNIIATLLQEYNIETAEDIQDALKDLLCGTIQSMMEGGNQHHKLKDSPILLLLFPHLRHVEHPASCYKLLFVPKNPDICIE